ncbi:uncharacterized protein EI90DRAFT_3010692 [Cantharellus anzutake]|uniref:uncharacterized protein n=1 Tax=Cantharellus anzutake TaxID=1750568 RepID=UPI0019068F16|nr:uncharacterized protein EI90DRAFT_3010692 [Cantharellus anzutake]KAF8343817.1 hypothetical protein EI90DRAFT_3010692 [Cantharellus anzutake]
MPSQAGVFMPPVSLGRGWLVDHDESHPLVMPSGPANLLVHSFRLSDRVLLPQASTPAVITPSSINTPNNRDWSHQLNAPFVVEYQVCPLGSGVIFTLLATRPVSSARCIIRASLHNLPDPPTGHPPESAYCYIIGPSPLLGLLDTSTALPWYSFELACSPAQKEPGPELTCMEPLLAQLPRSHPGPLKRRHTLPPHLESVGTAHVLWHHPREMLHPPDVVHPTSRQPSNAACLSTSQLSTSIWERLYARGGTSHPQTETNRTWDESSYGLHQSIYTLVELLCEASQVSTQATIATGYVTGPTKHVIGKETYALRVVSNCSKLDELHSVWSYTDPRPILSVGHHEHSGDGTRTFGIPPSIGKSDTALGCWMSPSTDEVFVVLTQPKGSHGHIVTSAKFSHPSAPSKRVSSPDRLEESLFQSSPPYYSSIIPHPHSCQDGPVGVKGYWVLEAQ